MKVAIIGTTSWGTTLGIMLARRGIEVALWARTKEEAERLDGARENTLRLPGVPFPENLSSTSSIEEALTGASLLILAVPSQEMRTNIRLIKEHIDRSMPILSATKGLEMGTARRMSQVIAEEFGAEHQPNICVLSGPNFSKEIAHGLPAATVIAAEDGFVAEKVGQIMNSPLFQVQTSPDMVGAELAGALKNIIALGAGMIDSLGYGANAKAAFVTRGLAEITRLGVAAGGSPVTFSGLAGLGDLIATSSSPLSRNRSLGEDLAKGRPLEEIQASLRGVVEGIATTAAARQMAQELGVEAPITEQIYKVLFEGIDLREAMAELIGGV
ncbi:MAG: NAD(P)H-dependent glycerol-3-phosphate dehydrogenase [Dehalococcoidia bacterium]